MQPIDQNGLVPPPQFGRAAEPSSAVDRGDAALRAVARQLESAFLAEMLKISGVGKAREAFGGGAGEDHFADLATRAHADALVARGGIGLAEQIFESIKNRPSDG